MDNPFRQSEPETQRSYAFLASLQFIDGILQWLARFVQLTEEEQEDAGIYLDNQHDR